ncbi:MAG TPA: hypothetical protein PL131_13100, partial [Methylotenera sp.]|nr:hypothetical protein [Methylotenera sp.]
NGLHRIDALKFTAKAGKYNKKFRLIKRVTFFDALRAFIYNAHRALFFSRSFFWPKNTFFDVFTCLNI